MTKQQVKPTPEDHAGEYCFDDRGRPRGGLWLSLADTAKSFGVSVSCVQAWRRETGWLPRFEGIHRGRVHLNVVQVFFWRCDKAFSAGRLRETVQFELPDGYETRGLYV